MMRTIFTFLLLFFVAINVNAQTATRAEIRNVDFEMVNDSLVITYDIVNATKDETFDIKIGIFELRNSETRWKISATSFTGDVNKIVPGGKNKRVVWHMNQDKIYLNSDVFVEIQATPKKGSPIISSSEKSEKTVNPYTCLLYSLVFPGAGNVTVTGKQYYYAIGIVGYSLAAWSMFSNWKASDSYTKYLASDVNADRNNFYDNSVSLYKRSQLLSKVAFCVWVADLTFTYLQANAHNKKAKSTSFGKWNLSPGLTFGYRPALSFQYHF